MADEKNRQLNLDELENVVGGFGAREKKCEGCKGLFSLVALTEKNGKYYCPSCLSLGNTGGNM